MTRYRLAVLGDPVDHSRSPALHHAMLRITELDGEYLRVRADSGVLAAEIEGLRSGRWSGLNITMPLKAEAARLAESLAPSAALAGSVNTLVMKDDTVVGESTDSTAFAELIGSERFQGASSILILGAGGSAAAALAAIDDPSSTVYLSARRREQAEDLSGRMHGEPLSWGTAVAGALVINTTPVGMAGETLPEGVLEVAAGLIDLPYSDFTTPAIATASRLGLPHSDGHEFLMRQAIASFAIWTGAHVELETLRAALRKT